MKNNLLDPGDDKQMRLFHKAVKVVLELDDERDDRTSAIIASIARGEGVNQKRKAKLRGAHFGFALRIANYFVKAAWNMPEFVDSDGYLTKSKWDELRSAALADQAPAA